MHGGQQAQHGQVWQGGGIAPPRQGALWASRRVYRLHRRRLLVAVWPVYAALTAVGLLNALLVVDEGDVDAAGLALTYGALLTLAGAFWTMPAVAGALEQGRAAAAAARTGAAPEPRQAWRLRALAPYRRVNTLSWLLLLSCIAIVLVPLVLPARLALALPAAVGEGLGAGAACRRSWRLTRGCLWRTWWLVVLTVVLVSLASGLSLWAGSAVAGQVDIGDRWSFVLGVVISLAVASVPLTFASARIGVLWVTWHQLLALRLDGPQHPPSAAAALRVEPARDDLAGDGALRLDDVVDGGWRLLLPPDNLDDEGAPPPVPLAAPATPVAASTALPGGVLRRAAALAIDLGVVWLLSTGIGGIVDAAVPGAWSSGEYVTLAAAVAAGVWLVYCTTLVGWLGQTLGKLAFGLEVVDARTGARATWRQSLLREIIRLLLTVFTIGLIVDYALLLRGRERRTLHDRRSGTAVVRRPGSGG